MFCFYDSDFFTSPFYLFLQLEKTVAVAQLVRASDCGSEGRGFETHQSPAQSRIIFGPGCFF